jgi:AraC-like DNA-binding protein
MIAEQSRYCNSGLLGIFFNLLDGEGMELQNTLPMVVHCAREQLNSNTRPFGPVIRRNFVVECNQRGHGSVIINGKEFSFGPGACYVLFPGDTVTHLTDPEDPRGGIYCIIGAPQLALQFKELGISSEAPFISPSLFPQVEGYIEKMLQDFNCRDAGTPMRQAGHIYGLMGALLRDKPAARSGDAIAKAIGMMDAHYPDPIQIEELAISVGLERTYFSSLFKEKTGYSPYRYLTMLRIQKACLLLKNTELSVTEVAEIVGLDSRNFARLFKKETGKTPLAYKRAKRPFV